MLVEKDGGEAFFGAGAEVQMYNSKTISVDFEKKCGKMKPLLGINGGPKSGGYDLPFDFSEEFSEMAVPFVRTASAAGEYGLNQFVNIHCIFPDFDADEELEESYNFLPTDLYLSSIKECGGEIFFRLGESPEPYKRKLYAKSPRDKEKWARICEHIIMHYNEGWADGFKMNIKYFEIWSGADRQECFASAKEEFFELYAVTALHLRERFPKIKIGGYGMSGFYAQNRLGASEEEKSYVPFMQKFLMYIRQKEAPLDFFTWCCHSANPEEIAMHSKYARNYLDTAGFRKTRSILCDYNTQEYGDQLIAMREGFPSEMVAAMITAQRAPIDMMFYATSDISTGNNGLFSMSDFRTPHRYAAFQTASLFAKLSRLGTVAETVGDYPKELYTMATFNKDEGALMLVTRAYAGKLEINLKGSEYDLCTVTKVVSGGERGRGSVYKSDNIKINKNRLALTAKKNEVYYFELKKTAEQESDEAQEID